MEDPRGLRLRLRPLLTTRETGKNGGVEDFFQVLTSHRGDLEVLGADVLSHPPGLTVRHPLAAAQLLVAASSHKDDCRSDTLRTPTGGVGRRFADLGKPVLNG